MNCSHGIDIDEYDCHECQAFLKAEQDECNQIRREIKTLLTKNGYNAELGLVWRTKEKECQP